MMHPDGGAGHPERGVVTVTIELAAVARMARRPSEAAGAALRQPSDPWEIAMSTPGLPRMSATQRAFAIATALCYVVGYPVALFAEPAVGWTLVTLGGVFLFALGVVTIRRLHRGAGS
jgi:hypothetical protein